MCDNPEPTSGGWRAAALLLLAASLTAGRASEARTAFDEAFRFAAAIEIDPTDRGAAEQAVVLDLAEAGALDDAVRLAESVSGWRRGVVWAELASRVAAAGRKEQARQLVQKAEAAARAETGWHGQRIGAHVAEALAGMGEREHSRHLADQVAGVDPRQYGGRAVAAESLARAVTGDVDGALEVVGALKDDPDLQVAWWRTQACLTLARRPELTREQRRRALRLASDSAAGIPGWRRAIALEDLAEQMAALDEPAEAGSALARAAELVEALDPALTVKVQLLARLGKARARHGDARLARRALEQAETLVPGLMTIDRPGASALVAEGLLAAGEGARARALLDRALDQAAELVNARPRALALVAICRAMGRSGLALDEAIRGRLDALYDGLGDPW